MISEKKRVSILIIDDTPMQLRILSQMLSPLYDIRIAQTGEKGLMLANKHHIDVILLDILMEGMSGYEVLESLKNSEKTRDIPVIFTSSLDSAESEIKGLSCGAVDYIIKPFIEEIVLLRVGLQVKLVKQMKFIEESTLYDGLTGIYNRQCFNLTLETEWANAVENGQCISLIMLDIDKFKSFNDNYGHLGGDKCLITVAKALKIRDFDTVFRWGGEEFSVLLPNIASESAKGIAERLRRTIEETKVEYEEGKFASVTISLGVGTIFPTELCRPEDFCSEVDKALYKAKENGRNRTEFTML